MNRVEVFICNNPNEISSDVDRFCDRLNYNPLNISITYDNQNRCYVAAVVLEKKGD